MKNKIIALSCVISVVLVAIIGVVWAATPGGADDPIISLSYLDQRISQLKTELTNKIDLLDNASIAAQSKFVVVEVPKGKKLIAGEGTEMILRMGKATVFASKKGGLANTTEGVDLQDGVRSPANSLLICPIADGRGLYADDDLLVMVKGIYTLN
ncbi:MAG: hypothetical protein FWE47_00955 [Oscillospiraceae bacterium]|nr:hypothetical protein [Oscillospiraceae bacterium]